MKPQAYKEKVTQGTVWNFIGTLLMLFIGIGSSVVYVRYLGGEQYGVAVYITDLAIFAVTICSLGLGTYQSKILQQLVTQSRYSEYKYIFINNIMIRFCMVGFAILIILSFKLFANHTSLLKFDYFLTYVSVFLLLQMIIAVLRGPLQVVYQQKYLNIVDVSSLIVRLLIVMLVIYFDIGLHGFLISEILIEIMQIIALSCRFNKLVWEKLKNSKMITLTGSLKSSIPMYFVDLSNKVFGKEYDVFFIGALLGSASLEQITSYSLSYVLVARVYSFLGLGTSNSSTLIMNFSSELIANGKMNLLTSFVEKQLKVIIFFVMPIMFGGIVVGGRLLNILYGNNIANYEVINALFFIGYSVSSISYVSKPILFVLGKEHKLLNIRAVLSVIKTMLLIVAIIHYGVIGAAVVTTTVLITSSLIEYRLLAKSIRIVFPVKFIGKMALSSLALFCAALFLSQYCNEYTYLNLLVVVVISSIVYGAALYMLKPINIDDYNTICSLNIINKLRLRKPIAAFTEVGDKIAS